MDRDNVLRLLLVEQCSNNAEVLISELRNAQYAVWPTRARDEAELHEALDKRPFDLLICAAGLKHLNLQQMHDAVVRSGKDVPMITLADASDQVSATEVIRAGARDLVKRDDMEHLRMVVARELDNLAQRRALRRAEQNFRESEKRCHALLDSSRDAIAYIHEGVHLHANAAYLEKFGFSDREEIQGTPVLDVIAPQDQLHFKDFLRRQLRGEELPSELELTMSSSGKAFNGRMEFSPATIEGEPCTQILIRDHSVDPDLQARQQAHAEGGNRVRAHSPAWQEAEDEQSDNFWAERVRQALDNKQFYLVFQPIVSLHGEVSERYEVLLRMKDEEDQEVLPGKFLPIAERRGLMPQLDQWVIGAAIRVLTEQRQAGKKTMFFVKVSGTSLGGETLLSWIKSQLKEARLQGDSLVFEITESAAVTHLRQAKNFLRGIKQLHCGFALEQFGTGLNSFQLLKHLPADFLKLDGSLIQELGSSQGNREHIKSLTETAHAMGKQLIAPFVENANGLAVLWQCGVNFIQGNFLQEPDQVLATSSAASAKLLDQRRKL
jgi:PAS domain S-box